MPYGFRLVDGSPKRQSIDMVLNLTDRLVVHLSSRLQKQEMLGAFSLY